MNVTTDMFAKGVEKEIMEKPTVPPKVIREPGYRMMPKYLRYNLWDPEFDFSLTTTDWTETAAPLWRPPASEFSNPDVNKTIQDKPHLFSIVTPINVPVFEAYLVSHPNQLFVHSVCQGLREGFWPWASTTKEGYPIINNKSRASPKDTEKVEFLRKQRDVEVAKGCFSPSFGKDLLPGMYSMLNYAVPKPKLSDFRLVTDQSCGKHSLNSMIQHDRVTGYPLDNMDGPLWRNLDGLGQEGTGEEASSMEIGRR